MCMRRTREEFMEEKMVETQMGEKDLQIMKKLLFFSSANNLSEASLFLLQYFFLPLLFFYSRWNKIPKKP